MKNNKPLFVVLLPTVLLVTTSCRQGTIRTQGPVVPTAEKMAFMNHKLPIDKRVSDLIGRMTLAEKVSQMSHDSPAIERLGVPAYNWWNECLHGVARAGRATVFPQAIGMAATFDEDLIFQVSNAISDEARAMYQAAIEKNRRLRYGGLTFWTPNINIFRDPRWGRGQETYGEDPHLTSVIGSAFVKGLQGGDPRYLKVAACAKHYAVHSGPEALRHEFNAQASLKDTYETYLPAFKALVDANVEAARCELHWKHDLARAPDANLVAIFYHARVGGDRGSCLTLPRDIISQDRLVHLQRCIHGECNALASGNQLVIDKKLFTGADIDDTGG